ncbi:hypothetical protein C2U72_26600 [Prosthecomicrobium hirschii]|nr:hypothetical protein C2U72_26600 [Prosthecomicrobium hirschii]
MADGEDDRKMLLAKAVSELRATYQIRLLLYRALHENRELVIAVPERCFVHASLQKLADEHKRHLKISRVNMK